MTAIIDEIHKNQKKIFDNWLNKFNENDLINSSDIDEINKSLFGEK